MEIEFSIMITLERSGSRWQWVGRRRASDGARSSIRRTRRSSAGEGDLALTSLGRTPRSLAGEALEDAVGAEVLGVAAAVVGESLEDAVGAEALGVGARCTPRPCRRWRAASSPRAPSPRW